MTLAFELYANQKFVFKTKKNTLLVYIMNSIFSDCFCDEFVYKMVV